MNENIEVKHCMDHLEVYLDGKFWFSADSWREIREELKQLRGEKIA